MKENLWSHKDVPHKGWKNFSIDDFGDDRITCEMCGEREVRWVHYMTHPNFEHDLKVGCVCAENMEEGYNGKAAEKVAKRKSNWISRAGKPSTEIVPHEVKKIKKDTITIFQVENQFYWLVQQPNGTYYDGTIIGGFLTSKDAKENVWQMYADEGWL